MFEFLRNKGQATVLAARRAVAEPQHPRVAEPAAGAIFARLGSPEAATVREDATVLDALRVMAERDSAAVAVTSPAGVVGIFSERDARMSIVGSRAANDTPVIEAMSRDVARVAPTDSVRRCLAAMSERNVAHAAVIEAGRLVGLLTQTDLLRAEIAYLERIFHETELDQKLLNLRGTYSC